MSAKSATVNITATSRDTSRILNAMGEDMRTKILVAGMGKLCRPITVAAKRFAKRSERTGALRESITQKVVGYPRNAKAVGLVGPDRAYYRRGRKVGKLGALLGADRPANYAHLVERGHHVVTGGKGRAKYERVLVVIGQSKNGKDIKRWKRGAVIAQPTGRATSWVPPKPFLRPAVMTTYGQQSAAFAGELDVQITRSFRRLKP